MEDKEIRNQSTKDEGRSRSPRNDIMLSWLSVRTEKTKQNKTKQEKKKYARRV